MDSTSSSGHESPIEVVTPPTVTKKSRPAKATPKAAGGDCGEATGRSFSATEVKLLIEILATLGESSNGIKFNWTAISEKLDLPSAGATYVARALPRGIFQFLRVLLMRTFRCSIL